jgi:outer membrane protein assembly factor BamB
MCIRQCWVLTGLVALSTASVSAGDWPQWRGEKRDGHSTDKGLLKEWPQGGPKLLWTAKGIGGGFSSVSVAQERIFTMGDGPDSSYVYALNEKDGKQVWTAKVGRTEGGDGYPGPRCTPTVDRDVVIALGQHGDLVCLETKTGRENWRKNLQKDFAGRMMSGWGYSESPLVDGDRVVCTPGGRDGAIVAMDRETGKELWRCRDFKDSAAYSSIVIGELGGVRQYVQLSEASVVGVSPKDGRLLWQAKRRGATAVVPTPIVHQDHVYVTSSYGVGCNLFKVSKSGDKFSVEEVYANKVMANHHGGVVRVGEYLYGHSDSKGWTCQEFKSGNSVWAERKLDKGAISYADGHLYLRAERGKGTVVLIEATPKAFIEKGRFDQPDRTDQQSWPHPVIANGRLYIRDQDTLLCYDLKG